MEFYPFELPPSMVIIMLSNSWSPSNLGEITFLNISSITVHNHHLRDQIISKQTFSMIVPKAFLSESDFWLNIATMTLIKSMMKDFLIASKFGHLPVVEFLVSHKANCPILWWEYHSIETHNVIIIRQHPSLKDLFFLLLQIIFSHSGSSTCGPIFLSPISFLWATNSFESPDFIDIWSIFSLCDQFLMTFQRFLSHTISSKFDHNIILFDKF